jgi:hypothetical protein
LSGWIQLRDLACVSKISSCNLQSIIWIKNNQVYLKFGDAIMENEKEVKRVVQMVMGNICGLALSGRVYLVKEKMQCVSWKSIFYLFCNMK